MASRTVVQESRKYDHLYGKVHISQLRLGMRLKYSSLVSSKSASHPTHTLVAIPHLSDPTYTVSGAKDFITSEQRVMFTGVERVANAKSMFSELRHFPRSGLRLKSKQDIPSHVDRSFHPPQHARPPRRVEAQVQGSDRHKFFYKPVGGDVDPLPSQP